MAAFLLNKYGPGGSRLAAAEAVATSADEEVVFEGEKTREERDAELRGEAVLLARDSTKMVKVGELP